jgi:HEAT repeat protein
MLNHAYSVGDWESFSLYVLAATHRPSTLYTHDLCMVLGQRIEDADNEGIVEALAEIRDPAAVPALEGALWWERDWDEYRALAIKVIWALTAIGTPEAIDVLRDAATTADERTRLFAASALKRFSR